MTVIAIATHPRYRPEQERLLTKREIARVLARSSRWVELAMRDRELPYLRDEAGHARFRMSDVLAWKDRQTPKEAHVGSR